jgi:membrane protein DedA with SNARE-associated domain
MTLSAFEPWTFRFVAPPLPSTLPLFFIVTAVETSNLTSFYLGAVTFLRNVGELLSDYMTSRYGGGVFQAEQ